MSDDEDIAPRALAADDTATPVRRATPFKPAPPAPSAPASTWDQIVQNADPRYTGKPGWTTTVFATPKDLRTGEDNGVGHPALGGIDTAHSYGVAVPPDVMEKLYGGKRDDPSTTANWRTARAQVTVNGKTYTVPISDVGPGKGPQQTTSKHVGRSTDLTSDFAKGIPGWMDDDSDGPVQIKLLPAGSGPDILKEPDKWHTEQQGIGKQLTPTPLGSTDIVRPVPPEPPKAEQVFSTAQADEPDDEDDPAYHWPVA